MSENSTGVHALLGDDNRRKAARQGKSALEMAILRWDGYYSSTTGALPALQCQYQRPIALPHHFYGAIELQVSPLRQTGNVNS